MSKLNTRIQARTRARSSRSTYLHAVSLARSPIATWNTCQHIDRSQELVAPRASCNQTTRGGEQSGISFFGAFGGLKWLPKTEKNR
eukprot:4247019-Pleurochrysis_carterae.AAC.1